MTPPKYHTPVLWTCPHCGELAEIVPLLNDFFYSGTHCTGGRDGIHYPSDWGSPVCSSCETYIEDVNPIN